MNASIFPLYATPVEIADVGYEAQDLQDRADRLAREFGYHSSEATQARAARDTAEAAYDRLVWGDSLKVTPRHVTEDSTL